jgi:hypothetical protein
MQNRLKKILRLYVAKFVRAKDRTGLPYAGLVLYSFMVYFLMFRYLWPARYVGELLQRIFSSNYSVNSTLASVYRQMLNFEDECMTLMRIVLTNRHDVNLLALAGEAAGYSRDVDNLEILRVIAEKENPSLFYYFKGILAYVNGHENYHVHFQEVVKSFFSLEKGGSPEKSGDSMIILMKRAIKSGHHIPEFVKMAYNIRELAYIDDLLKVDRPSSSFSTLLSVLDETPVSDSSLTDPIVLISCSDCYLNVFADYYIRIFRRKNQNIIHFHVLSEDVESTKAYLVTLKEKYSNICYSIETLSGNLQTYITLSRFLICRDLMMEYSRDVLISDLDFYPNFDINLIGRELKFQGSDIGLCYNDYSVPWIKFSVGFSYFRIDNEASDVFLDLFSRHLTSLYSDGCFFGMDSSAATLVYEFMIARGYKLKIQNIHELIDFKALFKIPKKLARGKIKCKFGNGAPQ